MVKNEEFYSRAQKARDYYKEEGLYLYSDIVRKIAGEVFEYGDEFPNELTFVGHHYSENMVKDVLTTLDLKYDTLTKWKDYFIIRNLILN